MVKDEKEWLLQADYDMETAEANLKTDRYIYVVFMCHLAIEKALKGAWFKKFEKDPPRTHSLTFLIDAVELEIPDEMAPYLMQLTTVSVPTRYPEQLQELQKVYDEDRTRKILNRGKEVLEWIKTQL